MSAIGELTRRVWYRLNRRRFEEELRRELEAHRDALGDQARFGSELRIREDVRAVWGWSAFDHVLNDARMALRSLGRSPTFTLTSILSLTAGLVLAAMTLAITGAYDT
jgi:hypothetical protein